MTISGFVKYVKQAWKNKPDTSTPLSAARLTHIEDGIKGNSDAIEKLAAAVVSQIVNDPNKMASMAALYSVNKKVGDTSKLPDGVTDLATAAAQLYSNLNVTLMDWSNIIYANEYLAPYSYVRVYKMGRLLMVYGSILFVTTNVVNKTIVSNLPVNCISTNFNAGASWGDSDGGVIGVIQGNEIGVAGTPTIDKEYRFQVVTFEAQ